MIDLKKVGKLFTRYIVVIYLVLLGVLLIVDAAYLALYLQGKFTTKEYIGSIAAATLTLCYVALGIVLLRDRLFEKHTQPISDEMDSLYFHGSKLWRWVDTDAFIRFQNWAESGICYELSVLAMMTLKGNPSATLYRGDFVGNDGKFKTRHAWVEFKIPGHGRCVADFSWIQGGFAKKSVYVRSIDGKLVPKWSCSYDEFWDTEFVKAVYGAARAKKTSHLLLELAFFGNPDVDSYKFNDICSLTDIQLQLSDGSYMIPFARKNGKVVSSAILRDFVKNPKRLQPRKRSIRLTYCGIKAYRKRARTMRMKRALQPA